MISTVVITKNEEKNIEKCLESIKWSDEIIIIDDNSSDKTIEIAKRYKANIYKHSLNEDFSQQRNFGLSKAKNDWVLFVDSDEVISDALAFEISSAIQLKDQNLRDYCGFYIKRVDFIWGKELKYGETGNIKLLRLAKKDSGIWIGNAHEKWKIKGLVGTLVNPIQHFPHKTLAEFLKEINFYTDIKTQELIYKKNKIFFIQILLFPLGKFLLNYLFKRGFLDGIHGLVFAIVMSFHSFLLRSKLWLKKNEE